MKKACPPARRGFALIYVLLFVVLLLIAVSATWFTGMADLRLSQRSQYSVQATQLAKAAIDDGWLKHKDEIGTSLTIPPVIFPDPSGSYDACTDPNPVVHRKTINTDDTITESDPRLQVLVNLAPNGIYDYKICSTTSPQIEGIGYYKGSKITLKAIVEHPDDVEYCSNGAIDFPTCTGGTPMLNHDADYITIYQSGPSQ